MQIGSETNAVIIDQTDRDFEQIFVDHKCLVEYHLLQTENYSRMIYQLTFED